MICPRSAILHSAAASIVDGIFDVTVSTAERIATRGVPRPICVNRSIAFWTMSRLVSRSGAILIAASVTNRVSGCRHVHDEHVADPARGAQPVLGGHRAHELIGVQAAFHQQLAFALADQLDGLRR